MFENFSLISLSTSPLKAGTVGVAIGAVLTKTFQWLLGRKKEIVIGTGIITARLSDNNPVQYALIKWETLAAYGLRKVPAIRCSIYWLEKGSIPDLSDDKCVEKLKTMKPDAVDTIDDERGLGLRLTSSHFEIMELRMFMYKRSNVFGNQNWLIETIEAEMEFHTLQTQAANRLIEEGMREIEDEIRHSKTQ